MIIDSLDIVTNNVNFGYAEPLYGGEDEFGLAKGGCSTVFMGQMMHFGGRFDTSPNENQYSIIKDCGMDVQYPEMPFYYYNGACNSFSKPTPKVLLCFSYDYPCHT